MKSKEKGISGILCVKHEGEMLCNFSKKWPTVVFRCPFIIGYDLSYFIININDKNGKKILNEFVDTLKNDEDIKFFEIIERNEYGGSVLIGKRAYGVLKALYDTKSVLKGPFIVKGGIKYFPIITFSHPKEVEKNVKKHAPKKVDVWFKIETKVEPTFYDTYFALQPIVNKLTKSEKEVLIAAYELGYFKWPKVHDSSDISKYLGISKTTFLEHLRKAEEKIISSLYKYITH